MVAAAFLQLTAAVLLTVTAPVARGQIFVTSLGNGTIQQFSENGGAPTTFASGLNYPEGLAFDSAGLLYVVSGDTIVKFPTVPTPGGSQTGSPFVPTGLFSVFGLNFNGGFFYVANGGANTIEKFTTAGTRVPPSFASTDLSPVSLAFDSAGNLYTANHGANTIQMFPAGGSPSVFASGVSNLRGMTWRAGVLYVADGGNNTILQYATGGSTGTLLPSTFTGLTDPRDVAFDSVGNLYAVSSSGGNGILTKFNSSGAVLWTSSIGANTAAFIAIQSGCAPGGLNIAMHAGLTLTGSVGCTYRIDYTTVLNPPNTVWTPLTTNTLLTNSYFYMDPSPDSGSRFYQAVVQ